MENEILLQILEEIKGIKTRLDSMETRMDSIENRLDSMEARMDSIENRLDSMEARMDSIENRMDSIENRMDSMEAHMGRIEVRIDSIEVRVDGLEQQITDLRDTQAQSELNITQQFAAMRDSQAIIINMGKEMLEIFRRERKELDESIGAKVAVDAKLVDHERRIDYLEQKVAV